jgi:hypothetical protein
MTHDVFISYSSKDKTTADAVCALLEEKKIRCWIAPRDIPAGQNFAKSIINALDSCKVFILIWSHHTNLSEHILNEINQAFDQGVTIIPFRIEDVQPTAEMRYYFGRRHWLDALTPPLEKHIVKLAENIYPILGREMPQESEPIETKRNLKSDLQLEPMTGKQPRLKPKTIFTFAVGAVLLITLTVAVLVLKGPGAAAKASASQTAAAVLSVTPTMTPVPATATKTPVPGTATATPQPSWVSDFAAPILAAIAERTPDFEDDFSVTKYNWIFRDFQQDCPNSFAKVLDGRMVTQADANCQGRAELESPEIFNFAIQVDMYLDKLDKNPDRNYRAIFGANGRNDFMMLSSYGRWEQVNCQGRCMIPYDGNISIDVSKPVTVLMISKSRQNAVYINGKPVYYFSDTEQPSFQNLALGVQGNVNTLSNIVEFDNVKIWDLNKIDSLNN